MFYCEGRPYATISVLSVPGLHQQRGARGALPPPRGAGRPAADGDPQHQLPLPPRQPRPVRRYICTIISRVPTLLHRYTFINFHNFHLKMRCFFVHKTMTKIFVHCLCSTVSMSKLRNSNVY